VEGLPYEDGVKQPFDLFTDEVLPLNGLLLRPLLDRSGVRVDLQMVLNHLPRDPRHLRWLLGKHIDISLEEGDERDFLFALAWTVFTGTSSGCTRGDEAEPCWRELDGARSWPPTSSAAL
jgi:hypothetical protein